MAEHGIDAVDLNEVQQLAGARNRFAVQYHFENREGLVAAVLNPHRKLVNERRLRMLDRIVRTGDVTPRTLVDALIMPLTEHLQTSSGQNYVLVSAQRTPFFGWQRLLEGAPSMDGVHRWVELVVPRLSGTAEDRRLRIGTTVLVLTDSLVDLARDLKAGQITYRQARHRARHVHDYMAQRTLRRQEPGVLPWLGLLAGNRGHLGNVPGDHVGRPKALELTVGRADVDHPVAQGVARSRCRRRWWRSRAVGRSLRRSRGRRRRTGCCRSIKPNVRNDVPLS